MTNSAVENRTSGALAVRGVSKRYGAVAAASSVSLSVDAGSLHAVIGENGAGKSTVMRLIAGLEIPDEGHVEVDGIKLDDAADNVVALVHQELSLVDDLSVAENVVLGAEPNRFGFLSRRRARRDARDVLAAVGLDLDVDELVGRLPLAQRQFVEIARALYRDPKVLVLDEPTATLTVNETDRLLALLRDLCDGGLTIVFISHRLPEVLALCGHVTVLRDGMVVDDRSLDGATADELISAMVGRSIDLTTRASGDSRSTIALTVDGVVGPGTQPASFQVHHGEVVALAGLVGAGRSEIARAVVGLDRQAGEVTIHPLSSSQSRRIGSYRDAIASGMVFVPEERRAEGVAVTLSTSDNTAAVSLDTLTVLGILAPNRVRRLVAQMIEMVDLRPPNPQLAVGKLSGGNQQKVAIGRWLPRDPAVVVVDEPTRGVDVGARAEIYEQLRVLAAHGSAILMVSSDLPEVLHLADRIIVVADGAIAGELDGATATEERVLDLASSGTHEKPAGT